MSQRLIFPDAPTAADVLTFSARAARLGDGAVRLKATGGTLLASAAPLAPRTLLESTPTVLGMRAVRVDPELVCDLVVPAEGLTASDDPAALQLPDAAVTASVAAPPVEVARWPAAASA